MFTIEHNEGAIIVMRYKRKTVRGLVLAMTMTAILIGAAFALVQITRDVDATVNVELRLQDGIEIYLDEALSLPADLLNFGVVEVDVFGTSADAGGVPGLTIDPSATYD